MNEKEYIVSLNKGVDYDAFNQEMIKSTGAGDIPSRSVEIANARPGSQRNTHYYLTDGEAVTLAKDSRVYAVGLRPDLRDDLVMTRFATQVGDFSKTTLDRGFFVNWGLLRSNNSNNTYTGVSTPGGYDYTLDGSGVDIVIHDSGIQVDHPEFYDYAGSSRIQQINWYTASGLPGTQNANHYRDYDGHGTHVAGITAGLTYGWAKGARLYSLKVNGLEGSGDGGTGIAISDCFDVIKAWHNAKPIDPATGAKRPTIVNMSWGYGTYFSGISGGSYRGSAWVGSARDTAKGMVGRFDGAGYRYGVRVASVDVDLEEMIDAGIHVCIAAGNTSQKIDVLGGLDYNNWFTRTSTGATQNYYNRGGSPFSARAHMVGNIDSSINSGGLEQKAGSSETGPGVSVYAPGTNIMSATSTINRWGIDDGPYPLNDAYLITNISGTSMASPQVAGIMALYCQLNPSATPAQALSYINTNAQTGKIYNTGSSTDYTNDRSLLGGNNRFAFNKFNSASQMRIGQTIQITDIVPATYSLGTSAGSVNEGGTFTISLSTTNIADGTTLGYIITGVSSADINNASLTGNFTVNSSTATAVFTVSADLTTEGVETFTLTLNEINDTISVAINDTSIAPVQTYALSTGGVASVNEGENLTITLTTTNVSNGTLVPYTISGAGITTADIGGNSLTGNFTVNSNTASLILPITSDATTESIETLTLALNNNPASVIVTINDTSIAGAVSYTLSSSAASVNEGGAVTVTLTTTNVANGTSVPYTISGAGITTADISGASLTGNFTVNSNTASLVLTIAADAATEGSETLTITLDNNQSTLNIIINDTSLTPAPTFALAANNTSFNEGDAITFTLTTTNVPNNTPVGYTITGVSSGDINGARLTGNFIVNSNTASLVLTVTDDSTSEGTEILNLALNNAADDISVTINDTSLTPTATYSLAASAASVNEGGSVIITLTTTNVANATNVPYTITGVSSGDINGASLTGNLTVNSNTASLVLTIAADLTTEGTETITFALNNGADTQLVTINDTSVTLAANYTINVSAADSNNYTLSGTHRNGSVSGNDPALAFNNGDIVDFVVNASGHPFWVKTAAVTGTGSGISSGVTNNGTQSGTVRWTVGSTGTFYYICQFHNAMVGTITIS